MTLTAPGFIRESETVAGMVGVPTSCHGSNGFNDIREGTPVTVKDEHGTVIGTGALKAGQLMEKRDWGFRDCQFAFTVASLPRAKFYAIEVSHRGAVTHSFDELSGEYWSVQLKL